MAERSLERERREAITLAALEKEARRSERQQKRLEHDKRKSERRELEAGETKLIEWKEAGRKDKKHKEKQVKESDGKKEKKKNSLEDGVVVIYDGNRSDKEKKGSKHRRPSSSKAKNHSSCGDKENVKSSTPSDSNGKAITLASNPSGARTAKAEVDSIDGDSTVDHSQLSRPSDASVMSLAPALLHNVPGGSQAQQLINFGQQFVSMIDYDGDSPLTALLLRLTDILDTFDCLNASITTLVVSLQKDPDALAMVGLTLAEISAIMAKTAPGVIVAAKAVFPVIFSLLASPQFLVTAGAGVICLGGYQIIRKVTGYGTAAVASPPKGVEEEDHLAFGPGLEDVHSEQEGSGKQDSVPRSSAHQAVPITGRKEQGKDKEKEREKNEWKGKEKGKQKEKEKEKEKEKGKEKEKKKEKEKGKDISRNTPTPPPLESRDSVKVVEGGVKSKPGILRAITTAESPKAAIKSFLTRANSMQ